jgi:hemerythrin-like domain-containing protein
MDDAIGDLLRQHDDLLVRLDDTAARLATLTVPLLELLAYLESEVEGHFALEEGALFPVLEHDPALPADTLPRLIDEHATARAQHRHLAEALRYGSVASQVRAAEALIDLLRAHVAKEDAVLAMAASTLSASQRGEVARRVAALHAPTPVGHPKER